MTVKKITESTLIPISFAIVLIGGGAAWMTKTDASVSEIKTRQESIDINYHSIQKDINEILIRVTKIDENLRHMEGNR